jgi:hypothetical protein
LTSYPSTIIAAVLIWGLQILRKFPQEAKSARDICRTTQTSSAQAYEVLERLKEAASHLAKAPGRPPSKEKSSHEDVISLLIATRDFLMDTPGAVGGGASRRTYHESFRRFVLDQMEEGKPGSLLGVEGVADAVGVPLGTLKDWISIHQDTDTQAESVPSGSRQDPQPTEAPGKEPSLEFSDPKLATILREFPGWLGSFTGFCQHLRDHHRLHYGNTFISSVLEMAELRTPKRRGDGTRPWSQGTYERFFPGAQWVGDGKQLVLLWNGERMKFNLEAFIDPASDAIVGEKVTGTENEAAVLETYAQAKATTGHDPLALTLDNRDSNHTKTIADTIAPAKPLASTLFSPTSKAPIEGAFGLLSQTAPPLIVTGETERDKARSALELIMLVWAWKRNHKPRRRLGGRTPAQVYSEASPTEADVARAKEAILRLERRQEEMRRTREAKCDPVRRQLLLENLNLLGIQNAATLATQLATYSREAIVRGLAIFRAKKEQGTLPPDVSDGRYLGGIIRNVHAQLEDELIAEHLLELRLRQKEISIAFLTSQMEDVRRFLSPDKLLEHLVDRALEDGPLFDFRFWKRRAADVLIDLPAQVARSAYRRLVRTITRSFKTPRDRRGELVASLSVFEAAATG